MKLKYLVLAATASTALISCTDKISITDKSSDIDKESYSLGVMIGKQLGNDFKQIDFNIFMGGFENGFNQEKALLNDEEMMTVLIAAKNRIQQESKQTATALANKNTATGTEFLAKNAKQSGVVTTKSGLQYKIITAGKGKALVKDTDKVTVNYKGALLDGTVFDSSYDRGQAAEFGLSGLIAGWKEALKLMPVGAKWQLWVPAQLAYGNQSVGKIGPNQLLVFDIELVDVNGELAKQAAKKTKQTKAKQAAKKK
jgi:FKBP-type peptidyl-prolyl cis-trans isomerase FklB